MRKVLRFIRQLQGEAAHGKGQYSNGYRDALRLVAEFITDDLWDRGEEEDGESE